MENLIITKAEFSSFYAAFQLVNYDVNKQPIKTYHLMVSVEDLYRQAEVLEKDKEKK